MMQRVQVNHEARCSSPAEMLRRLPPGSAWKELALTSPAPRASKEARR